MTTAIERLADHLGVVPSYVDHEGTSRDTTDDTRRALIRAMGHDVPSDAAAAELLEQLLDDERRQLLEPVALHQRGAANHILVRAPRRQGAVRWRIEIRSERGRLASREGLHESAGPLAIETPDLGIGYYDVRLRLTTSRGELTADQTLIVVPDRCVVPSDLLGDRLAFGTFANLYTIRGPRNWGVGDVGDLETLTRWTAEIGGSFVGLNPLHALLNRGADISPYGPVSRLWRNPIYIDVDRVPEFAAMPALAARIRSPEIEATLEALRGHDRVRYEQVWATKNIALTALHDAFLLRGRSASGARAAAYTDYVEQGGASLARHAIWMTIAEALHEWSWRLWPADLRDPASEAVQHFAAEHARRVDFHQWLQFELDRQIGEVAAAARDSGMEIGLYQDLAVGSSGTGSDAWAHRELFRDGASIGAPPDAYSDFGQNWGIPPVDPRALRRDRYRYFIRLVRAALRHAGALRIDHVMGLFRLFWIPEGGTGRDGAYVRYPSADLLGILALESQRHRALVVGENLGIVPPEIPPAMAARGILSSKVLYFERGPDGAFRPGSSYDALSLASANTHDMPTIAGFWAGRDIELRGTLGLIDESRGRDDAALRERDKQALVTRMREEGALPLHEHPAADASGVPAIKRAVNAFLCATPAALVGLSLDDLGGETEPVNVPGVGPDRYPSWSRKMRRTIPEIAASSADELAGCTDRARPS